MELDCSPQREEAIRQILGQRRQNQFISVLMRNEALTRAAQHLNVSVRVEKPFFLCTP